MFSQQEVCRYEEYKLENYEQDRSLGEVDHPSQAEVLTCDESQDTGHLSFTNEHMRNAIIS